MSQPSSSSADYSQQPIKVVYINTQYVETDAVSFKSVVQNLTGRDSTAAYSAGPGPSRKGKTNDCNGKKFRYGSRFCGIRGTSNVDSLVPSKTRVSADQVFRNEAPSYLGGGGASHQAFLTRDISAKELDRLMKELPAFDELQKLLSFD